MNIEYTCVLKQYFDEGLLTINIPKKINKKTQETGAYEPRVTQLLDWA